MARLGTPIKLPPVTDWEAHNLAMRILENESRHSPVLHGRIVKWSVADGYAYYRIEDDGDFTTLHHIDYCDGYAVHEYTIRGLRRGDLERMVEADRALERLMGGAVMNNTPEQCGEMLNGVRCTQPEDDTHAHDWDRDDFPPAFTTTEKERS